MQLRARWTLDDAWQAGTVGVVSVWSNRSVRTKLSLATMAACAAALAMVSGGVVLNELFSARAQLTARLESVGDVIAATSAA
ncbi:MAG: hypothetical protein U0Q11_27950, partial [Vicinamibacterales bacterium]